MAWKATHKRTGVERIYSEAEKAKIDANTELKDKYNWKEVEDKATSKVNKPVGAEKADPKK